MFILNNGDREQTLGIYPGTVLTQLLLTLLVFSTISFNNYFLSIKTYTLYKTLAKYGVWT